MGCSACVVFDESLTQYDFGPTHPMNPMRVDLTMRLADRLGVLGGGLPLVTAPHGTDDDLLTVHTPALVDAVRRSSIDPDDADLAHGLGSDDNPTFKGMHEAARHVVGATIEAARQVWSGSVEHAANVAGGLHHAMPDRASGFCVYNDIAIAIRWLQSQGARRIAYVDLDVHHGDGVEAVFWDDPDVLTISLHETGQMLFPGTGFAHDLGGRGAEGSAVNVALPPGTADAGWLRAFHAVVPPLLREFAPDVLVTQHGCDTHMADPLAHLMLSVDGQRAAYQTLHELSHEVSGGKWLAVGGGGYAVVEVVPRAWTHLLGVVSGRPVDPDTETPQEWRDHVADVSDRWSYLDLEWSPQAFRAPLLMTDGRDASYRDWAGGFDPDTWLDRSVQATRTAAFPLNGLDPLG